MRLPPGSIEHHHADPPLCRGLRWAGATAPGGPLCPGCRCAPSAAVRGRLRSSHCPFAGSGSAPACGATPLQGARRNRCSARGRRQRRRVAYRRGAAAWSRVAMATTSEVRFASSTKAIDTQPIAGVHHRQPGLLDAGPVLVGPGSSPLPDLASQRRAGRALDHADEGTRSVTLRRVLKQAGIGPVHVVAGNGIAVQGRRGRRERRERSGAVGGNGLGASRAGYPVDEKGRDEECHDDECRPDEGRHPTLGIVRARDRPTTAAGHVPTEDQPPSIARSRPRVICWVGSLVSR